MSFAALLDSQTGSRGHLHTLGNLFFFVSKEGVYSLTPRASGRSFIKR